MTTGHCRISGSLQSQ